MPAVQVKFPSHHNPTNTVSPALTVPALSSAIFIPKKGAGPNAFLSRGSVAHLQNHPMQSMAWKELRDRDSNLFHLKDRSVLRGSPRG